MNSVQIKIDLIFSATRSTMIKEMLKEQNNSTRSKENYIQLPCRWPAFGSRMDLFSCFKPIDLSSFWLCSEAGRLMLRLLTEDKKFLFETLPGSTGLTALDSGRMVTTDPTDSSLVFEDLLKLDDLDSEASGVVLPTKFSFLVSPVPFGLESFLGTITGTVSNLL